MLVEPPEADADVDRGRSGALKDAKSRVINRFRGANSQKHHIDCFINPSNVTSLLEGPDHVNISTLRILKKPGRLHRIPGMCYSPSM